MSEAVLELTSAKRQTPPRVNGEIALTVWFTADLHLGHANIIKYCDRPFMTDSEKELAKDDRSGRWTVSAETLRRHDDSLIRAINDVVSPRDTLWILGDFCWGDLSRAGRYRRRIHCRNVHLVWGNHDRRSIAPLFGQVKEQGMIRVQQQLIWLNHYPMRSWNKAYHGSWHLYGHVHGRLSKEDEANVACLTRDVGVDACDFRPLSFEELLEYMTPRLREFRERKMNIEQNADAERDEESEDG